ncbi:MAG: DHA2 family efflux MFS transporter permease subunit [Methanobacteriaceae archaeon]|nr:DHA2 family efflux MFS transporter permease subunit [Methanobacteriaceae archaeon]
MNINFDKNTRIVLIFVLAAAVLTIAQSIVTTGVVCIMDDFAVSSTIAQWTYSAFLLVVGVMIPLSAFISRRFRVKSVFLTAMGLFIIGSIIAFFSVSIEMLIFGRVIEAIGNGIIIPFVQILLLKMIPEEKWQIYMGVLGLVIGIAPVCGSLIGGFIIDYYTWRLIFLILTVLAIVVTILGLITIDVDFGTEDYPLDYLSVFLSIIGCSGVMFGFTNTAEYGLTSPLVIIPIIVGIIALIFFVRRQRGLEKPLINLSILKNKYFTIGLIFICILYFCLNGYTALVPIFVQGVAYYSPSTSAMIIFPGALLMIFCNILAPILVGKIGIKKVLIIACCLSIIGHGSMMFYTAETSVLTMTITQMFRLVGAGFALMPATTWSLTMVADKVEDGTAVNNTLRQISAAIGSSMITVIVALIAGGSISHNLASVIAFNKTAFIVVILNLIMLSIVLLFIKDKDEINSEGTC